MALKTVKTVSLFSSAYLSLFLLASSGLRAEEVATPTGPTSTVVPASATMPASTTVPKASAVKAQVIEKIEEVRTQWSPNNKGEVKTPFWRNLIRTAPPSELKIKKEDFIPFKFSKTQEYVDLKRSTYSCNKRDAASFCKEFKEKDENCASTMLEIKGLVEHAENLLGLRDDDQRFSDKNFQNNTLEKSRQLTTAFAYCAQR